MNVHPNSALPLCCIATYTNGEDQKPLEPLGEVLATGTDPDENFFAVIKLDQAYLDWLERSRMPQNRSEGWRRWLPFTRIKKRLWRS